jgi:hypothetical protein
MDLFFNLLLDVLVDDRALAEEEDDGFKYFRVTKY